VNLRVDPFEQHMDAPHYPFYVGEKLWTVMPAAALSNSTWPRSRTSRRGRHRAGFNPDGLVEALLQAAAQRQGNQLKGASSHGR